MLDEKPVKGGVVTWACSPGFPPAVIFPFTPPERFGSRSVYEFQALMYRPLYWFGTADGGTGIDFDLSLAHEPVWEEDGRTVSVRIKPWKWSNGETLCADNVMFWMNMLSRKGPRYGNYVEGFFPDNLVSFEKTSHDTVRFVFDKQYSKNWVLMNQLTMINPMPKAWDRTAEGPANASEDIEQVEAVYDYLLAENGNMVAEDNADRVKWADSPIWSVVNGPWRLKSYTMEGVVTLVPNEHYSGPNPAHLDEFRQIPTASDEEVHELLLAGPDVEGGIQVGFLPPELGEQPDNDPTVGGPNPVEGYTLIPDISFNIRLMALNFNNPTVSGRLIHQAYVRQALQSSLDQDYAVRDLYRGYGWAQSGPVPMLPKNDLVSPRMADGRGAWPFDTGTARKLLESNGWDTSVFPAVCVRPGTGPGEAGEGIPEGTKLSLLLRYAEGRPAFKQFMERFAENAAEAGIELRLQEVYGSVLVAEDGPGPSTPENPRLWEISTWNGGWVYNHPSGENLFKSGAASNYSNYADARADELIAATVVSDDPETMFAYQDYISEQVPVIFLPNAPWRLLEYASNLRGYAPINPYGLMNPENWYYVETEESR